MYSNFNFLDSVLCLLPKRPSCCIYIFCMKSIFADTDLHRISYRLKMSSLTLVGFSYKKKNPHDSPPLQHTNREKKKNKSNEAKNWRSKLKGHTVLDLLSGSKSCSLCLTDPRNLRNHLDMEVMGEIVFQVTEQTLLSMFI